MLDAIFYKYSLTGIMPKPIHIFYPKNLNDLQSIADSAVKNDNLLLIKGYRTSIIRIDSLNSLTKNFYVISTNQLNNLAYPDNGFIIAEGGVKWDNLFSLLLKYNLRPPIYPLFSIKSSIGGLIATNSFQSYDGKYGLANYLIKSSIFNGNKLAVLTKRKNDIIGSLGCLGLIIHVKISIPDDVRYDMDLEITSRSESSIIYSYKSLSSMSIPIRLATLYKIAEGLFNLYLIVNLKYVSEYELSHILNNLSREVGIAYKLTRDPMLFIRLHKRFLSSFINGIYNLKTDFIYVFDLSPQILTSILFKSRYYVVDLLDNKAVCLLKEPVKLSDTDMLMLYQCNVARKESYIYGTHIDKINRLKLKYDEKSLFPYVKTWM